MPGIPPVDEQMTLACVCNGSWYGGSFHPVPEADSSDGLLDVLLVKKVSRLTVARVISAYQKGRYADYPELISLSGAPGADYYPGTGTGESGRRTYPQRGYHGAGSAPKAALLWPGGGLERITQ